MKILAIDPGTTMGWAFTKTAGYSIDACGQVKCPTKKGTPEYLKDAKRARWQAIELKSLILKYEPAMILYEMSGGSMSSRAGACMAASVAIVVASAAIMSVEIMGIPQKQLSDYFKKITGIYQFESTTQKKGYTIAEIEGLYRALDLSTKHHAADACLLLNAFTRIPDKFQEVR